MGAGSQRDGRAMQLPESPLAVWWAGVEQSGEPAIIQRVTNSLTVNLHHGIMSQTGWVKKYPFARMQKPLKKKIKYSDRQVEDKNKHVMI